MTEQFITVTIKIENMGEIGLLVALTYVAVRAIGKIIDGLEDNIK